MSIGECVNELTGQSVNEVTLGHLGECKITDVGAKHSHKSRVQAQMLLECISSADAQRRAAGLLNLD